MSEELLTYIKDTVTRIETKQDKMQDDHGKRLRDVESWQANANGKMSIIGVLGVTIGTAVTATIEYLRGH